MRLGVALSLVMVGLPLVTGAARADDVAEGRALHEECLRLFRVGDFAQAVATCKRAYVLDPDPAVLYTLGQAFRLAGDHESAVREYRQFLAAVGPTYPEDKRRVILQLIDAENRAAAAPAPSVPPASASPASAVSSALHATVAVDLGSLDEATYADVDGLELEQKIVLRLVEEGFSVVGLDASPRVVLRVRRSGGSLTLEASCGASTRHDSVTLGDPRAELQLEAAQKAVPLARACVETLGASPATPDETGPGAAEVTAVASPTSAAERFETRAGLGALVRGAGADPLLRVALYARILGRVAAVATVGFAPSVQPAIDVTQTDAQLGLQLRLPLLTRLTASIALLGGVLWHHYSLTAAGATNPDGDRITAVVSVPLALTAALGSRWTLSAGVTPIVGGAVTHVEYGATLWSSGTLRLEVAGSVGRCF